MECKHEWIDMKDGTNDQVCVRCSLKQKQAVMRTGIVVASGITQPILRETMTIQSYGRLHEVDKEEWMKEFNKSLGIEIKRSNRMSGKI